jgi:hypothetical protein
MEHRERNGAETPIGLCLQHRAGLTQVFVVGSDPVGALLNACHACLIADQPVERAPERLTDAPHPAHGLKECGLEQIRLIIGRAQRLPRAGFEQLMRADRPRGDGLAAQASAGILLEAARVAARIAAHISKCGIECAGAAQALEQLLAVLTSQRRIERLLVDRLGEQLRDHAAIVGLDAPIALRPAAESPETVQVAVVVDLNERLERHAEALAVPEQMAVVVGDAPRTGRSLYSSTCTAYPARRSS